MWIDLKHGEHDQSTHGSGGSASGEDKFKETYDRDKLGSTGVATLVDQLEKMGVKIPEKIGRLKTKTRAELRATKLKQLEEHRDKARKLESAAYDSWVASYDTPEERDRAFDFAIATMYSIEVNFATNEALKRAGLKSREQSMANNVPPELEDKFKSCKDKLIADGKSEDEAYAICYTSVVEKTKAKARPKLRTKARKHNRNAPVFTVDDIVSLPVETVVTPTLTPAPAPNPAPIVLIEDDTNSDDVEYMERWAAGTTEVELPEIELAVDVKCDDESMPAMPMVTSFDELEAADALQKQADLANELVSKYRTLQDNILYSPDVSNKGDALVRLARDLRGRLDSVLSGMKQSKVGARHSKADNEAVQGIHDHAVSLGAMCGEGKSAFVVVKALDGSARWLGVVSNNFRDLDGEIITEEAHKEFIAYLDANPDKAPELWTWHTPGTARKSRADFWGYTDGFVVMGGPLTKEEAQALDGLTLAIVPGMSHGFYRSKQGKTITRYRTFEVSVLPQDKAANPWTEFSLITQEVGKMFDPEKRKVLVTAHGEDYVTKLEKGLGDAAKELKAADIAFKQATATTAQPETQTQTAAQTTAPTALTIEQVKEAINVEGLQGVLVKLTEQLEKQATAIESLQADVKEMKKSDDEKVAKAITPRVAGVSWGVRASEAKETLVGEDATRKSIAGASPSSSYDWLQAVGS